MVGVGGVVLVIDIGGGTTDFTLIAVEEQAGEIALKRIAVGDHILLGGDNIDAALAHHAAAQLPKLDPMQFYALWQQCPPAKERLLPGGPKNKKQTIPIPLPRTGLLARS